MSKLYSLMCELRGFSPGPSSASADLVDMERMASALFKVMRELKRKAKSWELKHGPDKYYANPENPLRILIRFDHIVKRLEGYATPYNFRIISALVKELLPHEKALLPKEILYKFG